MRTLTHAATFDAVIWLRDDPGYSKRWGYYIPEGGANHGRGLPYRHFEVFSSRVVSR